jgi:hypothetical protein
LNDYSIEIVIILFGRVLFLRIIIHLQREIYIPLKIKRNKLHFSKKKKKKLIIFYFLSFKKKKKKKKKKK